MAGDPARGARATADATRGCADPVVRPLIACQTTHVSADRTAVVVEDDPDIRLLVLEVLEMAGFAVHEAPTGREGIDLVRELEPDLVTLDLGLPDLDGTEVCRRIRQFTDAYVIMITARRDEIDQLIGLEMGADDFIVKPFSPRALQARVAAMFRRSRSMVGSQVSGGNGGGQAEPVSQEPDGVIRRGALEVDLEGRLVHLEGKELHLTRTEFDLLATMLSGPRRVWTREALLRAVWGGEWNSDLHLVEVHMGNLRRKLGDSARSSRWIQTVRGVGYRLAAVDGG